jgi:hypothetical protein
MKKRFITALAIFAFFKVAEATPTITVLSTTASPLQYEKYEVKLKILGTGFTNPYDPDQINVNANFEYLGSPAKTYAVNGFYMEGVTASYTNSNKPIPFDKYETLSRVTNASGEGWTLRFAPNATGSWRCTVYAIDAVTGSATPVVVNFNVGTPPAGNHGFISKANLSYLKFSDQTPFYPIGNSYPFCSHEDSTVQKEYGTWELKQVMNSMSTQNINSFRLFINFGDGINLIGKDRYQSEQTYLKSINQLNAWQLDEVVNYAKLKGIYLNLALMSHSMYSDKEYGNCGWTATNPFHNSGVPPVWGNPSYDNSRGSCTTPFEMFTNADAIKITKNMMRYVVARWAYSTTLMSYELWDEWDTVKPLNTYQPNDPANNPCSGAPWSTAPASFLNDVIQWHQTMKNHLNSIDPYQHLVTTAAANGALNGWAGADGANNSIFSFMDYTQMHHYADYNSTSFGDMDEALFIDYNGTNGYKQFYKPFVIGETFYFANDPIHFDNPYMTAHDPYFYDLHCGLWSSLHSGFMGVSWYWDNIFIYKGNALFNYKGVGEYAKSLPQLSEQYISYRDPNLNNSFRSYYLKNINGDKIYGWVQDKNFSMRNIWTNYSSYLLSLSSNRPPYSSPNIAANNKITFSVAKNGVYDVKWFNTETGAIHQSVAVTASSGQVEVIVPLTLRAGKYADAAFIIEYRCSGQWNAGVLNNNSPAIARPYKALTVKNNQVNYIGTDNRVHQMYRNGYYWQDAILGSYSSVRSDSDLGINQTGNGVYFVGTDNKIHEYLWNGTGQDIALGGPGDVRAYSPIAVDAAENVYYVGTDNKIHRYYYNGSSWQCQVLSSGTSENVAPKSDMVVDANNRLFFVSNSDFRIHKMEKISNVWTEANLVASAYTVRKDPNNAANSNSSLAVDLSSNNAVFFVGTDSRVHEIYLSGATWVEATLNTTAPQNVRNDPNDCQNMLASDLNGYAYFVADDNRVHQYYYSGGWIQATNNGNDPQNVCGGLATEGSNVYFISNTSRVWSSYWSCQSLFNKTANPTGIVENNSTPEENILIFPVPASDQIHVIISGGVEKPDRISIYDMKGTLIHTELNSENTITIDVADLPSGLYLLQVTQGNVIQHKKFQIVK